MERQEMDRIVGRLQAFWSQLTKDPKQCTEFILNFERNMSHITEAVEGIKAAATALGWADAVEPLERDIADFTTKYNDEKEKIAERKRKFFAAITSPDQVLLDGFRMKRVFIDRMLNTSSESIIGKHIDTTGINIQDLHAKAEADAILRDIPVRIQDDCCQGCAELGKECQEHQRPKVNHTLEQPCMPCVMNMPCAVHNPVTSTADIYKAGFDVLTGRVAQLKADLAFEQTRHAYTKKQLEAALGVIEELKNHINGLQKP